MNCQGPRRRRKISGRRGEEVIVVIVISSPSASSLPSPRHGGVREHSDGEVPSQRRRQRVSRLRKPRSWRRRRRRRGGARERGRSGRRRGSSSCCRFCCRFHRLFGTAAASSTCRPRIQQRQGREHVPEGVQGAVSDGGEVAQARDGELKESFFLSVNGKKRVRFFLFDSFLSLFSLSVSLSITHPQKQKQPLT